MKHTGTAERKGENTGLMEPQDDGGEWRREEVELVERESEGEAESEGDKRGIGFQKKKGNTLAHAHEESDEIERLAPWKRKFITSMRRMPLTTVAAREANVSPSIAYNHRESDELFRRLWDESIDYGKDRLEAAAISRAVDGVEKPVYGRDGQVIGHDVVYSDKLLETVLKGNLPEKYRENTQSQLTVNILNWSNGSMDLPQPVEHKADTIELGDGDVELLGD
jgi:hypothetical protein